MNRPAIIIATIMSLFSPALYASHYNDLLEGNWVVTSIYNKEIPRAELHFKGNQVEIVNVEEKPITTEYTIKDIQLTKFVVNFEYSHDVTRGNGRVVTYTEHYDLLFHIDGGHFILSNQGFEYDGRGPIIMEEYMKKEELIDGYQSELSQKLNNHKPVPTYKE